MSSKKNRGAVHNGWFNELPGNFVASPPGDWTSLPVPVQRRVAWRLGLVQLGDPKFPAGWSLFSMTAFVGTHIHETDDTLKPQILGSVVFRSMSFMVCTEKPALEAPLSTMTRSMTKRASVPGSNSVARRFTSWIWVGNNLSKVGKIEGGRRTGCLRTYDELWLFNAKKWWRWIWTLMNKKRKK